jgi:hypothetical protein
MCARRSPSTRAISAFVDIRARAFRSAPWQQVNGRPGAPRDAGYFASEFTSGAFLSLSILGLMTARQ